jgi:hypothetical protein
MKRTVVMVAMLMASLVAGATAQTRSKPAPGGNQPPVMTGKGGGRSQPPTGRISGPATTAPGGPARQKPGTESGKGTGSGKTKPRSGGE